MERIDVPPNKSERDHPVWSKWFQGIANRHNMYMGTADPVVAEVPQGQWILYKNTTSGEIRWWINDNGVMMKSAAFT